MKGLQFFGNRVEDAANAFIDVLKYSDQSVDYPDFKDIEPWPDEIINMFYVIWKNAKFSELSAIIMYTQQSSRFEEISELPNSWRAKLYLGSIKLKERNVPKANALFTRALEESGQNDEAVSFVSGAYVKEEYYDEAVVHYNKW